ncbi:MAG: class I SAM-dependent methyltransferase [Prevotella sp.]|nr:class I SAM-dependent methyltransferase [Prevotella sp.]
MTSEEFILLHRNDDVKTLALNASKFPDIDFGYALDQIAGWQKARTKLPEWANKEGIIYPPHLPMEQCSSEKTARYKADVAKRLIENLPFSLQKDSEKLILVDLTGGFGVDFSYMASTFEKAVYVELQESLCDIIRYNLQVLGRKNCTVVNADSEQYLARMLPATLIFVDPARRDQHGGRTFAITDCTPNVLELKELLLKKSEYVILKLSPMLDWHKVISDFGNCVGEVHIVSSDNECKELLIVISRHYTKLDRVFCVNDNDIFSFAPNENSLSKPIFLSQNPQENISSELSPNRYLYEPNPSIMKAGCFPLIEQSFGVREVGKNSHLFVSDKQISSFPGRSFFITAVTSMNRNQLKATIGNLRNANIAVRNFPLKVAELRKRLKLADGGDTYIFATTVEDGRHLLAICRKAI